MISNHHRGGLSLKEAHWGIKAAAENARDLVSDAELLLTNGRFARSLALSLLAIEECAKVHTIAQFALAKTVDEAAPFWEAFRDHRRKNVAVAFLGGRVSSRYALVR